MPTIAYPETRRDDVVDEFFGQSVADPYRWLENDVRADAEVAAWVETQNAAARDYIEALPGRAVFADRLRRLYDHDRVAAPHKRGNRYFYTRHSGLQNQPVLWVRDGVDGEERVLLDPNTWSADGATALAEWAASEDGAYVAYAVQDGGTDWRTIKVLDVASGEELDDEVKWARFSSIAWAHDGSGFFYARYPEPEPGTSFQALIANHTVWFHALGTPQAADRLLYATPDRPELFHEFDVTDDGRYAVINSTPGSASTILTVVDLESSDWRPRLLVDNLDDEWSVVGNTGTTFYLMTSKDAERRKIAAVDLAEADPVFRDLVGEQPDVLSDGKLVGGRLLLTYLDDVKSQLRRCTLDGAADGVVELPGIGTAGDVLGKPDDDEAFFVFTSYDAPTTVYRYDVAANTQTVWAEPEIPIDLDRIVVEQRFFASKDGTKIPLFIVRRKDVRDPAPTLLYGYGGFSISLVPAFDRDFLAWIEQGGVAAVANLRGGGEYGKAWHDAGRRLNKQNVFDDFIAAAEFLIAEGIAAADGLAILGGSNGGLLVGAVVNQRPDLFAAALPGVGVMDMLRFNEFTGGQYWVDEYGDPAAEAHFRNLLAYSPYHNIASGQDHHYPAVLATTADTDDRVVPGHTFKYVAALQAAEIGPKPRLARIETRAGHGAGKPIDKHIEETADLWAFAAYWTGLEVRPIG